MQTAAADQDVDGDHDVTHGPTDPPKVTARLRRGHQPLEALARASGSLVDPNRPVEYGPTRTPERWWPSELGTAIGAGESYQIASVDAGVLPVVQSWDGKRWHDVPFRWGHAASNDLPDGHTHVRVGLFRGQQAWLVPEGVSDEVASLQGQFDSVDWAAGDLGPLMYRGSAKTGSGIDAEVLQFVLDIIGIFDPTGIADLISGVWAVLEGRWSDAFWSAVSLVPFGDILGKPAKLLKFLDARGMTGIASALRAAGTNIQRIGDALSGFYRDSGLAQLVASLGGAIGAARGNLSRLHTLISSWFLQIGDWAKRAFRKSQPGGFAAEQFPTPKLAQRTNDPDRLAQMGDFANRQAEGASAVARTLDEGGSAADAYAEALRWRQSLKPGDPSLSRVIPDGDANIDPFGTFSQVRREAADGSIHWEDIRGSGNAEQGERIAGLMQRRTGWSGDGVLQNHVRLPDGTVIPGSKMYRGDAAEAIDRAKAESFAAKRRARGLDDGLSDAGSKYEFAPNTEKFFTETASPAAQRMMRDAAMKEFDDMLAGGGNLERFSNAAYLLFMSPIVNRGSDSTIRSFLAATYRKIYGRTAKIPQDIDVQAYARGQADFTRWLRDELARDAGLLRPTGWVGSAGRNTDGLWSPGQWDDAVERRDDGDFGGGGASGDWQGGSSSSQGGGQTSGQWGGPADGLFNRPKPGTQAQAQAATYVVTADDLANPGWFDRLCERYGVSYSELRRLNGDIAPSQIRVGQRLRLPDGAGGHATSPATVVEPTRTPASPGPSGTYVVTANDLANPAWFTQLCERLGVGYSALRELNGGIAPSQITAGYRLRLPASAGGARSYTVRDEATWFAVARTVYGIASPTWAQVDALSSQHPGVAAPTAGLTVTY